MRTKEEHGAETRIAAIESIARLNRELLTLIESGSFAGAAALFADDGRVDLSGVVASGRGEIDALFSVQYAGHTAPVMHRAYRQSALHPGDSLTLSDDGRRASAIFHVEVQLARPYQGESMIVRMARQQGQLADHRWEAGRFEATYVRRATRWQVATLDYKVNEL